MSFKIITIQTFPRNPDFLFQKYVIAYGYQLLAAHFQDRVESAGGSQYRQQYILHPSTKKKGFWQLSVFSVDGEPLYDSLFSSLSDALKEISPIKHEIVNAEFRETSIG